jgi:hypothetical protein
MEKEITTITLHLYEIASTARLEVHMQNGETACA